MKIIVYWTTLIFMIILLFCVLYFVTHSNLSFNNFMVGKDACENINLIKKGSYHSYPPLTDLINETEFKTLGKISSFSNFGEWKGCSGNELDNCNYVDCSFPARLCFPSTSQNGYCENIELNLIVDYNNWIEWKNQQTTQ